jgi:hypothetical protein
MAGSSPSDGNDTQAKTRRLAGFLFGAVGIGQLFGPVEQPQEKEEEEDADTGQAEQQHGHELLYRNEQAHGHSDDEVHNENENQGGYPLVHQRVIFGWPNIGRNR